MKVKFIRIVVIVHLFISVHLFSQDDSAVNKSNIQTDLKII